ncbi:TPA: hypothetical protein DEB29_03750 [Candidatus Wolfebacteria bacterium]|nr:hypothetical protein [Candidatus Wolfebacteria bacterium]
MEKKHEDLVRLSMVLIALMDARFVRVDGLQYKSLFSKDVCIIAKGERCATKPVIKTDCNNGKLAVVLPTGTVWLRANDAGASEAMRAVREAADTIPVVNGCHVPLSNQEEVPYHDLLKRFANPEWEPEYLLTEEAREAGSEIGGFPY